MTEAQEDRMADLAAEQIGETDDGLVVAQADTGRVYLVDEYGEAWVADWKAVD